MIMIKSVGVVPQEILNSVARPAQLEIAMDPEQLIRMEKSSFEMYAVYDDETPLCFFGFTRPSFAGVTGVWLIVCTAFTKRYARVTKTVWNFFVDRFKNIQSLINKDEKVNCSFARFLGLRPTGEEVTVNTRIFCVYEAKTNG